MAETGFVRFPGGLDPTAEEFRPRNPNPIHLFNLPPPLLPPHVYYPYPPPPPPPLPTPTVAEVVAVPYVLSPAAYFAPQQVTVQSPIPPPAAGPTRAVLLKPVPCDVSEVTIRREMEVFGQVRWVQMERACDGIVTVHFYDLRHAERALAEIREQNMQYQQQPRLLLHHGRRGAVILTPDVWAHFVIPVHTAFPDGHNQGTIVIFNLDSAVTTSSVKQTFLTFGAVKELRETPLKRHQKFVEFFDVRHAARALKEMNGKEFHGKQIVIEFSRPGGNSRKKLNSLTSTAVSANVVAPPPELYLPELPQAFPGQGQSGFHSVSPRMYSQFSTRPNLVDVESLMGEMNFGGGVEERESVGQSRRVSSKKQGNNNNSNQGMVTSPRKPPPPPPRSSRGKRGRVPKKYDTRFLIKDDITIESTSDSRTTLMIKNIPNKYSQKLLLSMLDNHCIHCNEQILRDGVEDQQPPSAYDFVYLPIDFNNKCNVGYGFVNMTSPEATWRLYKAFHHQNWEVFNSRKICEVTYARVQGPEALKEHFKNSKFPSEMDHYLPVVFTPPRDGKLLTDPVPIFGIQHKSGGSSNSSSSSSSSAINHPITLLLPPSHQHSHDDMGDSDHCSNSNGGVSALNDDQDDDDDQDS